MVIGSETRTSSRTSADFLNGDGWMRGAETNHHDTNATLGAIVAAGAGHARRLSQVPYVELMEGAPRSQSWRAHCAHKANWWSKQHNSQEQAAQQSNFITMNMTIAITMAMTTHV